MPLASVMSASASPIRPVLATAVPSMAAVPAAKPSGGGRHRGSRGGKGKSEKSKLEAAKENRGVAHHLERLPRRLERRSA